MKYQSLIILSSLIFLFSCKKENSSPAFSPTDKGNLEIEFDNVVALQDMELNTGVYTNSSGEAYSISTFDYYVSSIVLKKEDGSEYTIPQDDSYFLIKEGDESTHVAELEDVPAGNYTGIRFTVGIDSERSVAPADERTGVLDPSGEGADMYWSAENGYIFLKLEGASQAAITTDKKFLFHIGGYGAATTPRINNIKTITLAAPAGTMATVRTDITPEIHLFVDADKIMSGSTKFKIADHSTVMFTDFSTVIAGNYADMFKIAHIHND